MPDAVSPSDLVAFTMPSLGADMDAGTIVEWHVGPGSIVQRGDIMAEVETDKSNLDVEVFTAGTVIELVVAPGVKVPVGTVLARLAPLGAATAVAPVAAPPVVASPVIAPPVVVPPVVASPIASTPAAGPAVSGPVARPTASPLTSPVVRHLAEQLHVDTEHLQGTGPGHRILRADVERAARRRVTPRARRLAIEEGIDLDLLDGTGVITGDHVRDRIPVSGASPFPMTPPPPAEPPKSDTMRQAIARLMERSWREIPHYHVAKRVDLHHALASLTLANSTRPAAQRVLPAALLLHAAARAAAAVPEVNGFWRDGDFVPGDGVHLAVVIALRPSTRRAGGLVAPVIHDAASKDLAQTMAELRDLVTRARAGRLRASEVGGATFTVTELGEGGVDSVTPIIHPPQVAILGLGAVHDEPWAEDSMLAVRPVVHATLSGDHRAVDGRIGSAYLSALSALLQESIET